jgi:penicillin-binding protein 2
MSEYSRYELKKKRIIVDAIILLSFSILFYGFIKLQIVGSEKYYKISIDNSVRQLTQYPVRGTIRDKNGMILVDNRPSFLVSVIPRQISSRTLDTLASYIDEDAEDIRAKIRGRYTFRPVIVKRDLSYETLVKLEENRLHLPGVLVEIENKRFYPPGVNSPHIFGYVGEVTREEAQGSGKYEPGELIGKSGLEYGFDNVLRGSKGLQFVRVDAEGRELGDLGPNKNIRAVPGKDLYLTLDYTFQQFAESLMVDRRGAIVMLDAKNGNVLCLVSKPDFDPRLLAGKISPVVWSELQSDTTHPLYSRGVQSTYPPGSTYKLVAAIAALQEKIITPKWQNYCPGYFNLGRKTIHCWNAKGHGKIDLMQAIEGSCNVYFYKLGLEIGLEIWAEYSKKFYFGTQTNIDLPNENKGLVPTVEYFNKRYGRLGWTKGNLANLAIGQGELLTTPLQMAQFVLFLANSGVGYTPHLTDYLYDKETGRIERYLPEERKVEGISDQIFQYIREGMLRVVEQGTGRSASIPGVKVAGKTGTSQNPHGEPHSWFIAFAPFEEPEIAIAVIIENGGAGSAVAAPVARMCMEKYFFGHVLPRYAPKKDSLHFDSLTIPVMVPLDSIDYIQPLGIQNLDGE